MQDRPNHPPAHISELLDSILIHANERMQDGLWKCPRCKSINPPEFNVCDECCCRRPVEEKQQ